MAKKDIQYGEHLGISNERYFDLTDLEGEVWRDIKGHEGTHIVSNMGRVKSLARYVKTRGNGRRLIKSIIVKPTLTRGYYVVPTPLNKSMHLLVAEAFIEGYDKSVPISFEDGNLLNCKLDNLTIKLDFRFLAKQLALPVTIKITNERYFDLPITEGAFGEGQRILFDLQIAEKHDVTTKEIRSSLERNINNFTKGTDYIDLLEYDLTEYGRLLCDIGYTNTMITLTNHIYIFSEMGYIKLVSCMSNANEKKWEVMNEFVSNYFRMRKELKEIKEQTPALSTKDSIFLDIIHCQSEVETALALNRLNNEVIVPLEKDNERLTKEKEELGELVDTWIDSSKLYFISEVVEQIEGRCYCPGDGHWLNMKLVEWGVLQETGYLRGLKYRLTKDYTGKKLAYKRTSVNSKGQYYECLKWSAKGVQLIMSLLKEHELEYA